MGKYPVSIKGNNYEAMADLVRRHHLALPDIRSKSWCVAPTAFRPLADGPQIKTLERAGSDRPGIYFLGGIHAREWGSADILINFVQQLTNAYRSQQGIAVGPKKFTAGQIQNIVNHKNIYVFPQANPDGRNFSIRYFVDLHSFSEDILYNWGDDVNQAIKPAMNFRNAEFDSKRGMANDTAYREYFHAADQKVAVALARHMRDAIKAVRGRTYTVMQELSLYPTAGNVNDYAYGRHMVDSAHTKVYSYTIE